MKSRRRHDLKANELADTLQELSEFFRKHGNKVLAGALLAVLAGTVGLYLYRSSQTARSQGWARLYAMVEGAANTRAEDLKILAQQSSDENLAALAMKRYADMTMIQLPLAGREERATLAENAQRAYETVIDRYPSHPFAVAGARIGLALLYEDLGKWEEARKQYEQLVNDTAAAGTGLPQIAAKRLESLDQWRKLAAGIVTTAPASTRPAETLAK